jgi:transposase
MTTKILALTDALGNLVRFVLLPGQRFDTIGVPPLIEGVEFGALIADKAFDSNDIIAELNKRGAKVVISQHPRRATPLQIDTEMYKWRHLIENFFCKLKEFKRIAMRADKTDRSFKAMIHLTAASSIHGESQQTLADTWSDRRCWLSEPLWLSAVVMPP